jgi:hypothetical protein
LELQIKSRIDTYTISLRGDLKRRLQDLRALSDEADVDFTAALEPVLAEFADSLEEQLTSPDRPIHTSATADKPVIRRRRRRMVTSEQPAAAPSRLEDLVPPNSSAATSISANGNDNTDKELLET